MRQEEVIRLASEYARQRGYAVEGYGVSVTQNEQEWQIIFQSKAERPGPGDFFTVYVDDQAVQVTNLVPGK